MNDDARGSRQQRRRLSPSRGRSKGTPRQLPVAAPGRPVFCFSYFSFERSHSFVLLSSGEKRHGARDDKGIARGKRKRRPVATTTTTAEAKTERETSSSQNLSSFFLPEHASHLASAATNATRAPDAVVPARIFFQNGRIGEETQRRRWGDRRRKNCSRLFFSSSSFCDETTLSPPPLSAHFSSFSFFLLSVSSSLLHQGSYEEDNPLQHNSEAIWRNPYAVKSSVQCVPRGGEFLSGTRGGGLQRESSSRGGGGGPEVRLVSPEEPLSWNQTLPLRDPS